MAWAVLAAALIGAGELVVHSGTVQGLDNHLTTVVAQHRGGPLNAAMKAVTWLGSWVALVAVGGAVVILVLRRRLPVAFLVLALVAWAGTQGGTTLAKHVVQRPRPPPELRLVAAHGFSWPSGHTATAILVFSVLAVSVWLLTPSARWRVAAIAIGALGVVTVAFSRIELGVHWTTDVSASIVFVSAWLCALGLLVSHVCTQKGSHPGEPRTRLRWSYRSSARMRASSGEDPEG
ncbi:MAG TPA: phosphatase PAP2 family protein [Acidimicrobiales bacterium]|nr:phosphatase PAP2 family protein [Acidimicrobiales bacterium]